GACVFGGEEGPGDKDTGRIHLPPERLAHNAHRSGGRKVRLRNQWSDYRITGAFRRRPRKRAAARIDVVYRMSVILRAGGGTVRPRKIGVGLTDQTFTCAAKAHVATA